MVGFTLDSIPPVRKYNFLYRISSTTEVNVIRYAQIVGITLNQAKDDINFVIIDQYTCQRILKFFNFHFHAELDKGSYCHHLRLRLCSDGTGKTCLVPSGSVGSGPSDSISEECAIFSCFKPGFTAKSPIG